MQDSQSVAVSNQRSAVSRARSFSLTSDLRPPTSGRQAFTLTELLIVIAIIAVLAGLIAAAAVNALRASKRNAIVLEIKNVSAAIENFKTDYGAYPPNAMSTGTTLADFNRPGEPPALVKGDFVRMFKKAFPRHQEPQALIEAIAGVPPQSSSGVNGHLPNGLSGDEALVFWLGGFSSNEQYPISGENGPSFTRSGGEIMEDRNPRYQFDRALLGPRNDGQFSGRSLTYTVNTGTGNQERQINFWNFTPKGSTQPLVYFDVSRHKPGPATLKGRYDGWAKSPASSLPVYALKQPREGVAAPAVPNDYVFVNQGKFQLIHAGLDDDFGDYAALGFWTTDQPGYFPDGPFVGAIADNLSNFTEGTLADASEE